MMALLEATNTLLDFDFLQNQCLSSSPQQSLESFCFSVSDNSGAQWTTSSSDDDNSCVVTSLTTLSPSEFRQPAVQLDSVIINSHEESTSLSSSSISSSTSSEDSPTPLTVPCVTFYDDPPCLLDLDKTEFTAGFNAGKAGTPESVSINSEMDTITSPPCHNKRGSRKTKSTRSPKGYRTTSACNALPPCRICADAASGFHYGVNTCEACKRFFRRALRRKRSFKCRGTKNCSIKGNKNNLCGYCRFKQCLALGMSKTAIKTGRYTHQKRAQNSQEVQRLGSQSSVLDMPDTEASAILNQLLEAHTNVVTNAKVSLEVMVKRGHEKRQEWELKKLVFGIEDNVTQEQFDEVFALTGLDLDERKAHVELTARSIDKFVRGYVRFGKGIPGFNRLSLQDQTNLLRTSRVEVWFLGAYRGYIKDHDIFYAPNNDCRHRCEMERLLGKEYVDCAYHLASTLQKIDLTFEEIVVLKAVCLTFQDRCELQNPVQVEELQWQMMRCFLHLLSKNHPGDAALFHKVMSWVSGVRDLSDLSRKALDNNALFSEAIRSNVGLVDMVLL